TSRKPFAHAAAARSALGRRARHLDPRQPAAPPRSRTGGRPRPPGPHPVPPPRRALARSRGPAAAPRRHGPRLQGGHLLARRTARPRRTDAAARVRRARARAHRTDRAPPRRRSRRLAARGVPPHAPERPLVAVFARWRAALARAGHPR